MVVVSNNATAPSAGTPSRAGEVNIVFRDQPRGTRPNPNKTKLQRDIMSFLVVLYAILLVWVTLCLIVVVEKRCASAARGQDTDGKFKCSFFNETSLAQNNATEICDESENKLPYCLSVFHQNMRTYNHKVTSSGCWSKDSEENDQCIKIAEESDTKSACIIQKIGGTYQAIFCCCLKNMCNASFKSLPSIQVKQNQRDRL